MDRSGEVKQAVADLMENLEEIGKFMLKEARVFLRRSWGASQKEFIDAVDHTAKMMKESGKWAREDIQRTAETIKDSWKLLDEEKQLDWDRFLGSLKSNVDKMGDLSQETFDICLTQAKEVLDKQWTAVGRIGEDQVNRLQEQTEEMTTAFKKHVETVADQMQETGDRFNRVVQAAMDAWRKPGDR